MATKTLRAAILIFALSALCLQTSEAARPDQPGWNELFSDMTPFRADASIFIRSEKRSMEKAASIYLEFPDNARVFQDVALTAPLPVKYKSFSRNGSSVIHDLDADRISFISHDLLPLSIFTLNGKEDSFFSAIKFLDAPMVIDSSKKSIELRVEADDLWISPGITLEGASGRLWVDAERMRPLKLSLSGRVEMDAGDVRQANLMMEFRYKGLAIPAAEWKKMDGYISSMEKKGTPDVEKAIRKLEKAISGSGKKGKK